MNCAEVRRLLDFEVADARPAGAALRDHLLHCPRCRSTFPEVADFLRRRPADAPGRKDLGGRRRVAVLALVLAVLGAGAGFARLGRPIDRTSAAAGSSVTTEVAEGVATAPIRPLWRPSGTAEIDTELVLIERDRAATTVQSYVVERATPKSRHLP